MTLTKNEHDYWEVRVKGPDGRITSRSTGTKNKDDALTIIREAKIREIELAAEIGVLSNGVASILISGNTPLIVWDAIPRWKEHMEYRRLSPKTIADSITWIHAWASHAKVEHKAVSMLTELDFDGWINASSKRKIGTRNVMLSALRSFCRFCHDKGWISGNPANLIRVDMSLLDHSQKEVLRRHCFTDEEVVRLIKETSPDGLIPDTFWRTAVIIGRYTGLRMGDIASLEWDCLDMAAGTLTVWTRKRDRRVALPLSPDILAETFAVMERRHPRFMFNSQLVLNADPTARAQLSLRFSKILQTVGIEGKSFHCLRATYISDCDAKGIPIEHISRSVGHWSTTTTAGYIRHGD